MCILTAAFVRAHAAPIGRATRVTHLLLYIVRFRAVEIVVGYTEVNEDDSRRVRWTQKDVVGFDVTVDDIVRCKVLQCRQLLPS